MLGFLRKFSKSHRQTRRAADAILISVLAQARQKSFFARGGVADTVTGRFDMITLHAFLVMRAMRHEPSLKDINQAFLDALFKTLDSSFREMGVSDPGVPRKMRQAAEAFYGRLGAYEDGLTQGGIEGLEKALLRNLYGNETPGADILDAVARYVVGSLGTLALLDQSAWHKGKLRFAKIQLGRRK